MKKFTFLKSILLWTCLIIEVTITATANKQCVRLLECPHLLNILVANPNDPQTIKLLQSSHCGFENRDPKVWCDIIEYCTTPDARNGTCRPIKECQPIIDMLKTLDLTNPITRKYIQEFRCNSLSNNDSLSVCCPNVKTSESIVKEPNKENLLPNPKNGECGIDNNLNRILGGEETRIDEFTWMAILQYRQGNEIIPACAGSLISNRYVLTAAHCVDPKIVTRTFDRLENVVLGEYDTRNETDCVYYEGNSDCADPVKIIQIESFVYHSLWNRTVVLENDIALLRLAETVTFTDFIKPVCLPNLNFEFNKNEYAVISGWGRTETAARSSVKLKVYLPIIERENCTSNLRVNLTDGQLCIGGLLGKDSCPGDSGGPVMCSRSVGHNSIQFLIGIVSFGHRVCGISPAVYTYVPKYVNWIFDNIRN